MKKKIFKIIIYSFILLSVVFFSINTKKRHETNSRAVYCMMNGYITFLDGNELPFSESLFMPYSEVKNYKITIDDATKNVHLESK